MLEIQQLVVERDGRPLRYELQLEAGQILAIQGRSGVGKSSLLSAIAGFLAPQSGRICWQGERIDPLPPEARPVSLLFQDHNLFEHLGVWDNLRLGFKGPAPEQALREAAIALEVEAQLNKRPAELSGGQRQRIALIRTLLRPEPLVLLDEPFAELDPYTRELAVRWTAERSRALGKTLLLVTHQAEEAERLSDRLWHME
ncbi:ATP-binding cassette domain-containing protein [Aestuariirhabdus litorea]|uniref:ATP-binding cassette domain-containing protein n=1 Tax=Aestuariirhabdus litorea TaxID=2528527 RepID=A0A3P3VT93_9GAMM|nr:ATP-binding cassette domain-containing protein [Aestuariirhabdus litorea]RRJ85188.1 ATP-binding cassette domain-containing protein [Aestuariirhabdus litorea]RWW98409.1 ATP-binding cassette domain-containing protein [Endozoicomonadaceae bacterium GTF-13]